GWYFGRRQKNIRDYFLADRGVPWWALSASIVATETSVVTFISVPGLAFAAGGNMKFLQLALGYQLGRLIIVLLFIPLYFKGELFTVYQVLDQRFGPAVKRAAASLFIVTRSLSDGVRIYATALVLVPLLGWSASSALRAGPLTIGPDQVSILIIGIVMLAFTYLGGISAVIWVEVIQLAIYIFGALACATVLLQGIPGGWSEVVSTGHELNKFQVFDFTFNLTRDYTFWSGVIGGAFLTTSTHGTDQFLVQRYLCAKNSRQASTALLTSGIVVFAQFVMFLLIGVMLFVFYQHSPNLPAEVAARGDRVFPYFIASELPVGVTGLVVAAILAAAMSSSLNALASTTLTDFYRPLMKRERSEAHYLKLSRLLTAIWGAVQIVVALSSVAMERRVVDVVLAIASFTNGPILGLFFLGTLTKRAGSVSALAGVIAGAGTVTAVWIATSVSWQWYVLIGSGVTVLVGVVVSLFGEARESVSTDST
ncbi:MAG TPA: sodium:solute symporter, partial [Blastocatellia bacterium]|nr:sodium:solute symporter [Blastocatellia bacterium]